jgi:hypothetical protein
MNDVEMTRALERGEIANQDFHHSSHLHVAWTYLAECSSVEEAEAKMRDTLRKFAASAGRAEKYHETITLFWVHLLAGIRAANADHSLEQVVRANPQLLEKNFPLVYYSRERLFSETAQSCWLEPDLTPLPTDGSASRSSRSPCDTPNRPLSR